MGKARVLIAGVGNVLQGDDGFGVEVVRRLQSGPLPDGVKVEDYGVQSRHLAYALLESYDTVVLVDSVARGTSPGTLCILEPDASQLGDDDLPDSHGLNAAAVLRIARELGVGVDCIRIVGCEPGALDDRIGLSPAVELAAGEAVHVVLDIIESRRAETSPRRRPAPLD
jgi:hydrogenase maturation protease